MEPLFKDIKLPEKKKTSERAELLKFFIDNILDPKGKKYRPAYMGLVLMHLTVKDLYYLKSEVQDRINRGENYGKYFWGSLKPH